MSWLDAQAPSCIEGSEDVAQIIRLQTRHLGGFVARELPER